MHKCREFRAPQSSGTPGDSIFLWHITILNKKLPLQGPKWLQQLRQPLPHSSPQKGKKERRETYAFFLKGHFSEITHIPICQNLSHERTSRHKEGWKIVFIQKGLCLPNIWDPIAEDVKEENGYWRTSSILCHNP